MDGDEEEEQGPRVTYSGEWRWGATHRSGDKIGHGALPARATGGEIKERRGGGVRYEGRGVRVESRPDAGKRRNVQCTNKGGGRRVLAALARSPSRHRRLAPVAAS